MKEYTLLVSECSIWTELILHTITLLICICLFVIFCNMALRDMRRSKDSESLKVGITSGKKESGAGIKSIYSWIVPGFIILAMAELLAVYWAGGFLLGWIPTFQSPCIIISMLHLIAFTVIGIGISRMVRL